MERETRFPIFGAMSILKDFLDPHRRRPLRAEDLSDYEAAEMVQPQQRLAQLLRSVSGAVKDSLDTIVQQQKRLIKGLEEYLGLDLTGVDAAAMTLVVECSGAVEQCERLLKETGLAELCPDCFGKISSRVKSRPRACDEVEQECEELLQLRCLVDRSICRSWKASSGMRL